MTLRSAVIETSTRLEYALAVTAAARIAEVGGLSHCFPVLAPHSPSTAFNAVVSAYDVERLQFDLLFPAASVSDRATRIRAELFVASISPVIVSPEAPSEVLAAAVWQCLRESRPLELTPGAAFCPVHDPGPGPHILLAGRHSRHAAAAAFYAHVTGKQFCPVDDLPSALDALSGRAESYLLVDEFTVFDKSFLARMLQHPSMREAPQGAGILTAIDEVSFTRLLVRMLLVRSATSLPAGLNRYRVLTEHGNEMHMELEGGEFLCGAANDELNELSFDCRPTCPHPERVPAGSLAVQHLLISSCNTFTLGDGIVGTQFNLLFRMVDGWCCSVIAPFKHALSGHSIPLLLESLARSGFSLGEIAERLNSIAPFGALPDPSYVLLGDPEVVIFPPAAKPGFPGVLQLRDSLAVASDLPDRFAAEWILPTDALHTVTRKNQGRLALVPLCDTLRSNDIYIAFHHKADTQNCGLLLFSSKELPYGRAQLAFTESAGVAPHLQTRTLFAIRSLYLLQAFGLSIDLVQEAEQTLLDHLRFALGYPRMIELATAELIIRSLPGIVDNKLHEIRCAVLGQFVELTAGRLWISQLYGRHYTSVRRQPATSALCPCCGCEITSWRYNDDCTQRPSRLLVICARCGIIADHPTENCLAVRMDTVGVLPLKGVCVSIAVTNLADCRLQASLAAQFHEWRDLGISARESAFSFELAPGETLERQLTFDFSRPFGDYMQDLHVFTLTKDFALSCFTQKMISTHHRLEQQSLVSLEAIGPAV